MKSVKILSMLLAVAVGSAFASAAPAQENQPPEKLLEALKTYQENEKTVEKRLQIFHTLDLVIYNQQQWGRFKESHARDIVVYYPDGTTTKGLADHIERTKWMFTWAPDAHIVKHLVTFGAGDWTAAIGVLTGTFTEPMRLGNGKVIQPTDESFHFMMATISRWNENNRMVEEYLFWNNRLLYKQIGILDQVGAPE